MRQSIPVVDLDEFRHGDANAQAAFVDRLGEALVEFGFIAIENHGVDQSAVKRAYGAAEDFFALPASVKMAYELRACGRQRGYTPFGKERARESNVADLKEFWHAGPELAEDDPLLERMPANVWPEEVPHFGPDVRALWSALQDCGTLLLRALARFLRVDEVPFSDMIQGGNTVLRMIRYPAPESGAGPDDGVWAAAHEDINLITLLVEATEPGLQILTRDGKWLDVAPIPGQLIADSGDMLQLLTNGRIPATTHRVLAPPDAKGPRLSMPFFIHPHPDFVLEPIGHCVTLENPARFRSVSALGYLRRRLRDNGVLTMDATVTGTVDLDFDQD